MSIEIKVPTLPESVADATVAKWYKKPGERINREENLLDLETDKVMLEVPAPVEAVISECLVAEGETVVAGQVLAILQLADASEKAKDKDTLPPEAVEAAAPATTSIAALSPSVRRTVQETGQELGGVTGTGRKGRLTKADVLQAAAAPVTTTPSVPPALAVEGQPEAQRMEKRVPMSRLRQRIAERLVAAQQQAAMLTTFNEVNMQPVMDLRKRYKDLFEKTHGVRLGFMSFFTKAVVEALKRFPAVNASVDGTDLIYHNYFDIGIAIGSPRGLVVPILRNAETLTLAEVEKQIREYAARAESGKLSIEEMTGGTFTITNGGTFGSMLSTPILNPPQSAILGMHNIVERPVVESGAVVVRPIMYLALSYDHRVIDGSESVLFLKTIKTFIEEPSRLLLEV